MEEGKKEEEKPKDEPVIATPTLPTPEPIVGTPVSGFKPKEKKERTTKQIAAFERMRAKRQEKRLLGANSVGESQQKAPEHIKEPEKPSYMQLDQKSIEQAAAMFMEMRRREKEAKKEMAWERQLKEVVTLRLDEFEDRLMDLFNAPIEQYVAKKQRKKVTIQEEEKKQDKRKPEPVVEEYIEDQQQEFAVPKPKAAKLKHSPFHSGRRVVESFYPEVVHQVKKVPNPFRYRKSN